MTPPHRYPYAKRERKEKASDWERERKKGKKKHLTERERKKRKSIWLRERERDWQQREIWQAVTDWSQINIVNRWWTGMAADGNLRNPTRTRDLLRSEGFLMRPFWTAFDLVICDSYIQWFEPLTAWVRVSVKPHFTVNNYCCRLIKRIFMTKFKYCVIWQSNMIRSYFFPFFS